MGKSIATIYLRMCNRCTHIHLEVSTDDGQVFGGPMSDAEWDDLFIKVNQMRLERDKAMGKRPNG